jgi:hypothetical protein
MLGLLIYPLQMLRIARRVRGRSGGDAFAFGVSCMMSKFPEFVGWCKFQRARRRGSMKIIEYK